MGGFAAGTPGVAPEIAERFGYDFVEGLLCVRPWGISDADAERAWAYAEIYNTEMYRLLIQDEKDLALNGL
jgi:hypothetical protein